MRVADGTQICLSRENDCANLKALYSLSVRMAQLIGLHEDPEGSYPPFEAEMRRRLWWHICTLESRGAEEMSARRNSIMEQDTVRLPANLNDIDLDPGMKEYPRSRSGKTDMFPPLLRFEIMRYSCRIWSIGRQYEETKGEYIMEQVKSERWNCMQEMRTRFNRDYLAYLHESRPIDLLCQKFFRTMTVCMIKANVVSAAKRSPTLLDQNPQHDPSPARRFPQTPNGRRRTPRSPPRFR